MKISLQLATAQGQWNRGENNNEWKVVDTEGIVLGMLPASFSNTDVMTAIRLGREFELKAFNIGIQYGKEQAAAAARQLDEHRRATISSLRIMNEQLSEQLDKHITGE